MNQLYRVFLDGQPLDALSDDIIITGISESSPGIKVKASAKSTMLGMHVEGTARDTLAVEIRLVIIGSGFVHRTETIDRVRGWCRAGWLTTTIRPGKRLFVQPSALPDIGTLAKSGEVSLTLTAYEMPWWEDETPTTVTISGNWTGELFTTGTEDGAACDLLVRNTGSETVNALTVTVHESMFRFTGLALSPGEMLRCTHSKDGYLRIMIEGADGAGRSAYSMRAPESDDELETVCGMPNAVTVEADGAVETTVEVRGRWT